MKTEEEYEAEVLQLMRDLYPTLKGEEKERAERLFPGLKESEDERIRKALIRGIKSVCKEHEVFTDGFTCKQIVSWLEKQREKKEINLIEILKHYPKETELYSPLYGKLWLAEIDEECEIITCYKYPLIEGCERAILKQEDTVSFYFNGTTGLPDFSVSKDCMLFLYDVEKHGEQNPADKTSLDFKKGDILYEQKTKSILLVYERNGSWLKTFCNYWIPKENLHVELPYENYGFVREMSLVPATKEQRDLLFQKIKEAGYEWDTEELKLEKIKLKFKIEKDKWYICIRDLDDRYGTRAFSKGNTYYSTKDGTLMPDNSNVPFKINCVNDYFRLWTIQDAKDGDVLYTSSTASNEIFIFKELTIEGYIKCYCSYDSEDKYCEGKYHFIGKPTFNTHPATRKQCDLLFSKMKEVGYEWNAEKKELKKIEQKSANNVIEEEKSLLEKFKQAVYDCAWGKVTCKKEGETKEEYVERWAEQFLLITRDWADDYIDFTIQQKLRNSYEKGKTDIIKEQDEQKPAWSEEDEVCANLILRELEQDKTDSPDYSRHFARLINWFTIRFKSLRPQNWTKEDKERYISCLQKLSTGNPEQPETINSKWFKEHVYPQTTWKPSEKQMEALSAMTRYCNMATSFDAHKQRVVESLYQDLKNLTEE